MLTSITGGGNGGSGRFDGPRYIDPNTPIDDQASVLLQLIKNPPENGRRVTITPQLAEHILLTFNPQKPRRPCLAVDRYTRDMAEGKWMPTGDTIKFGRSGMLLDGRRRLAACVRSGRAFTTHVIFGISDVSSAKIDVRRKRTSNGPFALIGCRNPAITADAVRWLLRLTSGPGDCQAATYKDDVLLSAYRGLDKESFDACVREAIRVHRAIKSLPASSFAALIYLFRRKSMEPTLAFLSDLKAARGPASKMVKRIEELRIRNGGRLSETICSALVTLTWQAYIAGRDLCKADLVRDTSLALPQI